MAFHPAFYVAARVRTRRALRAKGVSFLDSIEQADDATNDVVDTAVATSGATVPADLNAVPVAATDGAVAGPLMSILEAIEQFFASGVGQQILAAILKLIGA